MKCSCSFGGDASEEESSSGTWLRSVIRFWGRGTSLFWDLAFGMGFRSGMPCAWAISELSQSRWLSTSSFCLRSSLRRWLSDIVNWSQKVDIKKPSNRRVFEKVEWSGSLMLQQQQPCGVACRRELYRP